MLEFGLEQRQGRRDAGHALYSRWRVLWLRHPSRMNNWRTPLGTDTTNRYRGHRPLELKRSPLATAVAPPIESRARPQPAVLVGGLAAAGAAAALLVALHVGDAPLRAPNTFSTLRALAIALYITVGSYTTWRRPGARFGFYLTGAGLFYAVATLTASHHQLPHSVGRVVLAAFSVTLAY